MLTWKNGPEMAKDSSPPARTWRRPLRKVTPSASTTNSVSGAASTELFPNRSATVEAAPNRMMSPEKSVAPAVIAVPFNSTAFPVMLVVEAAGLASGVAPKTKKSGTLPHNRIPARKSRNEKQGRWRRVPRLLDLLVRALTGPKESVFIYSPKIISKKVAAVCSPGQRQYSRHPDQCRRRVRGRVLN